MTTEISKNMGGTLIALIFLFFFNIGSSYGDDLDLLLSFKSSINDPFRYLSGWDSLVNFCHWNGITCNNSSRVTGMDLSCRNITGNLSSSLFQLPYVEIINLSNNQFSGEIPSQIFTAPSSLKYLNLNGNNLTGEIPRGANSALETLDLSNNVLSGNIHEDIGGFRKLRVLDLGGNLLMGKIPNAITNLTRLEVLTLASNQLVGEISSEISKMKSLKWIYLGYNNFSGKIPPQIGELSSLNHLDLVYNNLTGEIPPAIGNLSQLQYLFLYQNHLKGQIPASIFGLKNLISLDLSDNSLSGEIPETIVQLQNLQILHLFSNNFTGEIPVGISSLSSLQAVQLWSNKFKGEIPKDLGKKGNLTVVDLSTNSLTGKIPENLCRSGSLFKLILFSNFLEGEIPYSLSHCKSLCRVRLQNNRLSGNLPPGLTKLELVYFLDLSGNNLSGEIADRKWKMPSLQMLSLAKNRFTGTLPRSFGSNKLENLDLSENYFTGKIPKAFGNFSELMSFSLSHNKLSGYIPEELSSCTKLVNLDLSHNQFIGRIPPSFAQMPVLGELDLSENQLSGTIPKNLGKVASLVQVNVSHNHLKGSLPVTGAFLAINSSAVAGNELCGGERMAGLPLCKTHRSPVWWFLVTCLLVVLALLLILAMFVMFVHRTRHHLGSINRVESEDGKWELQVFDSKASKSILINDVLSSMNGKNVASSGRKLVTKEINEFGSIPSTVWDEVAEIGKLSHPNIAKLIGTCKSEKGGVLIYEFIDGRILSEVLSTLSWDRRRKIAVGIARALRFLHCNCSKKVLIGDLCPENVIVDGKDEPRLRLSLPGLLMDSKCIILSAYAAPETKERKDVSEKSDIYAFGLILIKLLTGKGPSDPEFSTLENIIEWARYCYSDGHLDMWVDSMIKPSASIFQNEMVQLMNIALHCTACDPSARPSASDLAKSMERCLRPRSRVLGLKFYSTI
ncbi:Leucine-rich repeat [Dillenia turbinata]|uniref:non-specific serine/threonine protein kinase n=1 Tax=Dillenia turbinata TaxID=194707 RepID=A0AAN8Z752_9MAGN